MGIVLIRIKVTKEFQRTIVKRSWEKVSDTGNAQDDGPMYGHAEYEASQDIREDVLDLVIPATDFDMDNMLCALFHLQKTRVDKDT